MKRFILSLLKSIGLGPKPKRLELRYVTYSEGENLVRQGWTISPEEDKNFVNGMVFLELLEKEGATK